MTPSFSAIGRNLRACCSASISVGAITAHWCPAFAAHTAAKNAVSVLPDPTSPLMMRDIFFPDVRSPYISPKVCFCDGVGVTESEETKLSIILFSRL